MSQPQPKLTPHDAIAQRLYELIDQIIDCGHASANIAVVPATEDGSPDHAQAHPVNMEAPSSDSGPQDLAEALRWVVLVDDIDACEPQTSVIFWIDQETGLPNLAQVSGPADDKDIAFNIIGRDIGAEPPKKSNEPSALQKSWDEFIARRERERQAERLKDLSPLEAEIERLAQESGFADGHRPKWLERRAREILAQRGVKLDEPVAANDNNPPAAGSTEEPLKFINPAEWHGEPVPQREWYAEGIIPMRQVTILNGDGGVGKSLLALQIAAAGAMKVDTLDMAPQPGRTLYVGAEDEAAEFHRRLVDITKAHGKDLAAMSDFRLMPLADRDALLAVPDRKGNMEYTPLWSKIVKFVAEFRPELIVLDTAADLFGGDEIKRGQTRQFIGMLRQVALLLDCAVVLLAHPSVAGMQSGTGSSGSTAWNNSVRSRLYLTRPEGKDADPDLRILKTMKSNYGTAGGEIKLRWRNGAFVLDDGKPSAASALIAAKAERVFLELLSTINRNGLRVSPAKSSTYAPSVMADMPDADGLGRRTLETAMRTLLANGQVKVVLEGPKSKQRQRLVVASEDFGPSD